MSDPGARSADLVILGGGSGGYACALRAAELGLPVVLVEKDKLGGTCLHRGCIPTKALLHAAEVADHARDGAQVGVRSTFDGVDMAGVNAYKDGVVSRLYTGLQGLIASRGITVVPGAGTLEGPGTVRVGDERITGRHVVLATGSYARSLPGLELDDRIVTSDAAISLDEAPRRVVVLGGGVIGVEFASVWRSFGAEVTVVEALPRLVPNEDEFCSTQLARAFRRRRITTRTGVRLATATRSGDTVTVSLESGEEIEADLLLVAVGRGPNTTGHGFAEAGVAMDGGFVTVDERLRTNLDGVYAVGDVTPGLQLAHRGFAHGIFVAEDVAGLAPPPGHRRRHPARHLLRPRGRLGRVDRAGRAGPPRRGAHPDLRPGGQREVADPEDLRGGQARRPGARRTGRTHPRRTHGGLPDRGARRGSATGLQLGGSAHRRRRPDPRPSHAERGPRRGPPRTGRETAAHPRLIPAPTTRTPTRNKRSSTRHGRHR